MGQHIVITGGTRGIGFALVRSYLERGCSVTFSGTRPATIGPAVEFLSKQYDRRSFSAVLCNVERVNDINELYNSAVSTFGPIDIWINNAAIFQEQKDLLSFSDRHIQHIFRVNLAGVMHVCRLVVPRMTAIGYGAVYNMEGFGRNGNIMRYRTLYGTTKRALRYFTRSFMLEQACSPVTIGLIQPGLAMTDMLREALPRNKETASIIFSGIYRLLTYPPEPVARYIVSKTLSRTSRKRLIRINYLTPWRILLSCFTAPARRKLQDRWLSGTIIF
ncbi:MAG: SDR family oxidoreductase [Spirochaetota bacterium]